MGPSASVVTGRPDPASWWPAVHLPAETPTLGPARPRSPFSLRQARAGTNEAIRRIQTLQQTAASSTALRVQSRSRPRLLNSVLGPWRGGVERGEVHRAAWPVRGGTPVVGAGTVPSALARRSSGRAVHPTPVPQ